MELGTATRHGLGAASFLLVLEPLVENQGICRQRHAVQINDFSIDSQLDLGGVGPPVSIRLFRILGWHLAFSLLVQWRSANVNARGLDHKKIGLRTAHQNDGRSFAFDLQKMRPAASKSSRFMKGIM